MKHGSADRYSQEDASKFVPEGVEGRVPYKGSVHDMVFQLCGGIRSGMGYVGAVSIEDLQKKAKFVKITNAGLRESHPTTCKLQENLLTTHWRINSVMNEKE